MNILVATEVFASHTGALAVRGDEMGRSSAIGVGAVIACAIAGCSPASGPPAELEALKAAPPSARGLIGFAIDLREAPMCKELGYTVDEDMLTDLMVRAIAAADTDGFDRTAVEKVHQAAGAEANAAYQARIARPGKALTAAKFKAEIEALYGFYDNWCAEAAADEVIAKAVKAPAGFDRDAAKAAAIGKVLKTAAIMQPRGQDAAKTTP